MKGSPKLKKKILKKAKPQKEKKKARKFGVDISVVILIIFVLNLGIIITIIYTFFLTNNSKISPISSKFNNVFPHVASDLLEPEVSAQAFALFEPKSRSVIFNKNGNLRFSPASTAKIMTALVSLEYYKLDTVLKAFDVSGVPGSSMGLSEGEEIIVENLLYGMMLPSGNDAAFVLAQNFPGGYVGFVAAMNEKAKELKLANTYFLDPAGLEDGNYTTASDLVHLASKAFENPVFRKIVGTRSLTVTDVSGKSIHKLSNLNELLAIPGVVGVKTGFTDEAGGVLVTAIEKDDTVYFISVLRSTNRFHDTKTVIDQIMSKIDLIRL